MPVDPGEDVFQEVLGENNAQGVLREIQGIEQQRSLLITRWIWELVQNARGAVRGRNDLYLSVQSTPDALVFCHNGERFKEREIAHLILHGSTKTDQADIGRFGTGFITTHLLSRDIRVRGFLEPDISFDFCLSRTGTTAAELRAAMQRSREAFEASKGKASHLAEPYTTEFRYPISPNVRDAVGSGIDSLRSAVPYLFAFNPMIKQLEIADQNSTEIYKVVDESQLIEAKIGRLRVQRNKDLPFDVFCSVGEEATAAVVVREVGGNGAMVIPPVNVPRVFIAFPLNGMERFPLPIVLNSEAFVPFPDRDGIPLSEGDSEDNKSNKQLLIAGCRQIIDLLAFASKSKWGGLAECLAISGDAHVRGSAPDDWLKKVIRDHVVEGLRHCPVITAMDGSYAPPASAWIPVKSGDCDEGMIWNLASKLTSAQRRLPRESEYLEWGKTASEWRKFAGVAEGDWPEFVSINTLSKYVGDLGSLERLSAELCGEMDAIDWLSSFYDGILKSGLGNIFSHNAIVPNQSGVFLKREQLMRDDAIGDDLKKIGEALSADIRPKLVDSRLGAHTAFATLPIQREERYVDELVDLTKKVFTDPHEIRLRQANIDLFRAIATRRWFSKLESFPVASQADGHERRTKIVLSSSIDSVRRPLAPVAVWPESAQPFAEIFSENSILAQEYDDILAGTWNDLARIGLVLRDPIYLSDRHVTTFIPDEPLADEERGVKSEVKYRLSNVAWGTTEHLSIFERSRSSSKRSLLLLRFFVDHALAIDLNALTETNARCDNGKDHKFYPAEWLSPLRDRKWVYVGPKQYDFPNAANLAQLLKESPALSSRLKDPRTFALFSAIGISPPEIVLRSLGNDDADRMSLIQSFSDISAAAGNDPARVQGLAEALRDDPETIAIIETRMLNRAQVAKNKALGDLVEIVFAEALGEHLKVVRTGPGHDYQLFESDELDGGVLQVGEGPRSVFVEIKATAGTSVRMSELQGKEAIKHPDSYILCVVPVVNGRVDVETFKQGARFVFPISGVLKPAWISYSTFDAAHKGAYSGTDVTLEVELEQVKFRIHQVVWQGGEAFENAIVRLRGLVGGPTAQPNSKANA